MTIRVLMVTAMYPTPEAPHSGTFIKSQVESLGGVDIVPTVLHLRGRSPLKYLVGMWRVLGAAEPSRFDVVHGHYGYCGIVARAQWRLPVVVSFLGDDLLGTPGRSGRPTLTSRLVVLVNRVLARSADAIIVKSDEMKRALGRGLRTPVEVIPNGVDMRLFRPLPRAEARQRLGLDATARYVVFPADPAIPRKAFGVVAEAAARLHTQGTPVEVLPVFGRPHSDMVDYYNAADVVVLPSIWEGSPNAIKEAMACGVPIVATPVGDVPMLFASTPGHWIVERTPSAIAHAIRQALDLPIGRTDGPETIAWLSLERIAARVRAVYERVLR
jgi:glycosyltransferase involved in cell wall biosynthesis